MRTTQHLLPPLVIAGIAVGALGFWLGRETAPSPDPFTSLARSNSFNTPARIPSRSPSEMAGQTSPNAPPHRLLFEGEAAASFSPETALPLGGTELADASRPPKEVDGAAATAALKVSDPNDRAVALGRLLEGVTAENAPRLVQALDNLPPGYPRSRERELLLYAWGQADGAAAAAYVQANMGTSKRNFPNVMDGWATMDPDGALAFLDRVEDPRMKSWLTPLTINGVAMTDPDRGLELAMALPAGKTRSSAFAHIVPDWIRLGIDTATARINQLPEDDGKLRAEVTQSVIRYMGNDYPEKSLGLAMLLPEGKDRTHLVGVAADEWAETNPSAAARWAAEVEDPALRKEAFREITNEWAKSNPAAAGSWLNDQAPSPARDGAVAIFAGRIVRDDPVTALNWASSIENTRERHTILERVMQHWQKVDPEAARAFLAQ